MNDDDELPDIDLVHQIHVTDPIDVNLNITVEHDHGFFRWACLIVAVVLLGMPPTSDQPSIGSAIVKYLTK